MIETDHISLTLIAARAPYLYNYTAVNTTPQYGMRSLFIRHATPRCCALTIDATSLPQPWWCAINNLSDDRLFWKTTCNVPTRKSGSKTIYVECRCNTAL
jgi:hypothetical protein